MPALVRRNQHTAVTDRHYFDSTSRVSEAAHRFVTTGSLLTVFFIGRLLVLYSRMLHSHFTTLSDGHILKWLVAWFGCARVFDLVNDVQAINHFAENNMLVVQKWRWNRGDEELGTVGIRS